MGVGLLMTYASTFQMLRGSVVVFTSLLSLVFLRKNLRVAQWIGLGILVLGLITVGISSVLVPKNSTQAPNPVLGNVLIVVAQLVVATQMVVEEHFLSEYNIPPLLVVGWEGVFGMPLRRCAVSPW